MDEGFLSQQYDEDQIVAKTLQGYNNWVATLEEGEAWFHNIHVDSFVVEDWRRAATNLHRAVRDAFA